MTVASGSNPVSPTPAAGPLARLADQLRAGRPEWLILLLLALVTGVVYAPSLSGAFVFDDLRLIPLNPTIKLTELSFAALSKVVATTRPVAMVSFALNYFFHQEQVAGYHLVNIALHIATGVLLYYFLKLTLQLPALRQLRSSPHLPWLATALWLLHPIQTQSVSYLVQRMNGLAAFFYLLALILYAQARRSRKTGNRLALLAATLLAAALAVGSKETAASLPFFLLLHEFFFFQDLRADRRQWSRLGLALGILFLFLAGVLFFFPHLLPLGVIKNGYRPYPFSMGERLLTELRVVIFYLGLLLWPAPGRLRLDYDFPLSTSLFQPFTTLLALLTILALLGFAVTAARRQRLLSFAIFWFFGNLLLESSIIPLDLAFEHRLYLPSMLPLFAVVLLGQRLLATRRRQQLLATLTLLCLASWSYQRNTVWGDSLALMIDSAEKSPTNGRPAYNVACEYVKRRNTKEAVLWLQKAVTASTFRYWNHLKTDPDLDPIRSSPEFREFCQKYQPISTK